MDVTNYYTILTIDCIDYKNIDDYLELIESYVALLYRFDKFISIKRIGIRKIGGSEFDNTDEIYDVFEQYIIFPNPVDDDVSYEGQSYSDFMYKQEKGIFVNFTRQCRDVKIQNKPMIQLVIDIDAYTTAEEMRLQQIKLPKDTNVVLNTINDYMFELFRNSINLDYLIKNER